MTSRKKKSKNTQHYRAFVDRVIPHISGLQYCLLLHAITITCSFQPNQFLHWLNAEVSTEIDQSFPAVADKSTLLRSQVKFQ